MADTIKYLVATRTGSFVIELPATYKLTFAGVNPAGQTMGRDLHCLRVWDGGGKAARLRGVFCDVRGFRDLSIPLARKVEKETGSASWTLDSDGGFERSERRELAADWAVEPDPPEEAF